MKKTKNIGFLLAVGFFFLQASPVFADMFVPLEVTARTQADVQGGVIRLSDIFEGIEESRDRDVALAPAPGKTVTYDVRTLVALSNKYRLGFKPQSLLDRSTITRAATRITPDMVFEAVKERLGALVALEGKTIDVAFDNRNPGFLLPAEQGAAFDVTGITYDEKSRRFRGEIIAQGDKRPIMQPVSGRVSIKKTIPVLARRLEGGQVLGAADLGWITVNEDQLGNDILADIDQVLGFELRRTGSEGDLLRARDLIAPRLVTRGSLVTLRIATPMMQITAQGRALQDGARGDIVRITNTQTNRMVEGVVESAGLVRVSTGHQKLAAAPWPQEVR
ncbi:MAG: flagellar basal body P-ring formation chaperone FlgA [Alphaproteobacteria bacterium]|nr:flagellar basal body P-ring formation chaperone FlgA [Alphaproteobacteria bacterium]